MERFKTEIPTARKNYACDASYNLEYDFRFKASAKEMQAIDKAKSNNFEIQKGEKYIKQKHTEGGENVVYRAIPEIHEIWCNYNNENNSTII